MREELADYVDNQKLLDLFKEYNLEFRIDNICEDEHMLEITPIIDEEDFDSYNVPLNDEGKIADETMIGLARRLSSDFDFVEKITYYNEKCWDDRLLMNEIEKELIEIDNKLVNLSSELEMNAEYYLQNDDIDYFSVDESLHLGYLIEKFGEDFEADEIAEKLQVAFETELRDNHYELLEKNNNELSDEDKKLLDEIMLGASMQVEDDLSEQLQLNSSKLQKQK